MLVAFRERLSESFYSIESLNETVSAFTRQDWQPVADLLAMQLPEFDAVYALPGAELLAEDLARARGVQSIRPGDRWPTSSGEVLLLTTQLQDGQTEKNAIEQAREAGWKVSLVVAAVEHTSLGGRADLEQQHVNVRAAAQVACTPKGLVFERRSRERWNN